MPCSTVSDSGCELWELSELLACVLHFRFGYNSDRAWLLSSTDAPPAPSLLLPPP